MSKKALKVTHDGKLHIGKIKIPCYVLEDGTRDLSQRGLQKSIGMSLSGPSTAGVRRLANFVTVFEKKGIKIKGLIARINKPIIFQPRYGRTALGFEAKILPNAREAVHA